MLTQGRVQSPLGPQSSRQTFARGPRASETSPTLTTFHIELPFGKTVVKAEIPVPFSFLRQQREGDLEKSEQSGGQSLEEGGGMSLRKAMCREEGESSTLEGPAKTGFRGPPGRRRRCHFLTQKCPLSSCRPPGTRLPVRFTSPPVPGPVCWASGQGDSSVPCLQLLGPGVASL